MRFRNAKEAPLLPIIVVDATVAAAAALVIAAIVSGQSFFLFLPEASEGH